MVMEGVFNEGRRDAARRSRKASIGQGVANLGGNLLGAWLMQRERNRQNNAILGFLGQLQGGSGGGIAGAAGGAVPTAPDILGALRASPDVMNTPIGQSVILSYLQRATTPTMELPGVGRVPYSDAALRYLGDMRSEEGRDTRLDKELAFRGSEAEATRAHQRAMQEDEIGAAERLESMRGLNRLEAIDREGDLRTQLAHLGHVQRMEQIEKEGGFRLDEALIRGGRSGLGAAPLSEDQVSVYANYLGVPPELVSSMSPEDLSEAAQARITDYRDPETERRKATFSLVEALTRASRGLTREPDPKSFVGPAQETVNEIFGPLAPARPAAAGPAAPGAEGDLPALSESDAEVFELYRAGKLSPARIEALKKRFRLE